jgi:hypothetical protein
MATGMKFGIAALLVGLMIATAGAASNQVSTVRTTLTLVDDSGDGLAGHRVDLLRENGKATGLKVETEEDGVASFEVLPGFRHSFRIHFNGGKLVTAVVEADEEVTVLTERTTLTLVNGSEGAVADVRVDLLKVKDNGSASGTGVRQTTDENGIVGFQVLPGFTHRLRARVKKDQRITGDLSGGTDVVVDLSAVTEQPVVAAKLTLATEVVEEAPVVFGLDQNYPNPFNPSTSINYSLPEAANVRLVIYNILGQEIRELVNEVQAPGRHRVRWNGRDAFGRTVATGLYLSRLVAGPNVAIRKMTFSK